jgi:hypothetical protein
LYVERATAAGWEDLYSSGAICPAIYTLSTVSMNAESSLTFAVSANQAGRYRVRLLVGPDNAAPEQELLSNEFVIH